MITAFRLSIRMGAYLLLALASVALAQSEPQVSAPMMNQLVTDYLTEAGFTPPADANLHMSDYVTILSTDDTPRVGVYVDKNGMLTPNLSWRQFNSEHCKHYAREILEPVQLLSIRAYKVVETDEGFTRSQYFMFGSLTDTETGIIQLQEEAGATTLEEAGRSIGNHPDRAGLEGGVYDLLDSLLPQAGIAGMADPCGDILVTHLSGNQVGEPAFFLAGYEGGFGTQLTYTWDFGDGSPATELTKTPEHTYHQKGTYTVHVTVTGDTVEPRAGSTEVTIGGDYEVSFKTKLTGTFPEGMNLFTTIEGVIPVQANADGTLVGTGMLHTTDFSGTTLAMMAQAGCTATLVDGPLDLTIDNISEPGETVMALRFNFSGDGFQGLAGAEMTCSGPAAAMTQQMLGHIGKTWWIAFAGVHQPLLTSDGLFHFTGFSAGSGATVSKLSISDSIIEDGAELKVDTDFTIRRVE